MKLNGKPDRIRVCVVSVPWICPLIGAGHTTEGIMRVSDRHWNIFIDGGMISLAEFFHSTPTMDLSVDFEEWMLVMNEAIGVTRRPPQVQPHVEVLL